MHFESGNVLVQTVRQTGAPLCGAAMTTIGSCLPLLWCEIEILSKLGEFIVTCTTISIGVALTMLAPLLCVFEEGASRDRREDGGRVERRQSPGPGTLRIADFVIVSMANAKPNETSYLERKARRPKQTKDGVDMTTAVQDGKQAPCEPPGTWLIEDDDASDPKRKAEHPRPTRGKMKIGPAVKDGKRLQGLSGPWLVIAQGSEAYALPSSISSKSKSCDPFPLLPPSKSYHEPSQSKTCDPFPQPPSKLYPEPSTLKSCGLFPVPPSEPNHEPLKSKGRDPFPLSSSKPPKSKPKRAKRGRSAKPGVVSV